MFSINWILFLYFVKLSRGYSDNEELSGSDAQVPPGGDNRLSDGQPELSDDDVRVNVQALPKVTIGIDEALSKVLESKNRGAGPIKKWRMGTVPYYIDGQTYDGIIMNRIKIAMKIIESASCVVFKNLNSIPTDNSIGTDWLHITNPRSERECVHTVRLGNYGESVMTLGYECILKRDIIHALLHVLGFNDEVTHPQRDSFVRILWENIHPKYHHLFAIQNKLNPSQTLVEYDTMSIMHFHDRAFSINGGATITPLISGLIINPSDGLSQLDKMKLRLAYGHECNKRHVENLIETCKSCLLDDEGAEGDEEADTSSDKDGNGEGNSTEPADTVPHDSNKNATADKLEPKKRGKD